MKRLFLLAFLCLQALSMSADYLRGRVVDASNGDVLPDVEVICRCSGDGWWFGQKATTDSLGCFFVDFDDRTNETMRLEVRFEYFGYHIEKKNILLLAGNDTVDIGDVRLRPFEELLGEAVVKGRVRRFTTRGDTIVFNPEAFHLEEGERLGELIKRLPGVTVQDGKLFWNNRPLRMQMNGENTLSAELLAELPVEAVDKIETYEKKSELAERTGHDDGEGEQVLNIKIKEGFLDKFYGNVQAKGLSNLGYQGSGQLMRLSTDNPLMIAAKVGDHMPNHTSSFGFDYENIRGGSEEENRQQIGALGYQHLWDSPYKEAKHRNNWDITFTPNHLDQSQSSWERREVFGAEGATASYTSKDSETDSHSFKLPLNTSWFANIGPKTTIAGNALLTFNRTSNDSHSTQSNYDDSFDGIPVNTNDSRSTNNGDNYTLNFYQGLTRYFDKGNLWAQLRANYSSSQNDFVTTSDYTYRDATLPLTGGAGGGLHEVQNGESEGHNFNVQGDFGGNKITDAWRIGGNYELKYTNNYYEAQRMRGDGITQFLDLANSQHHRYQELYNSVQLGVMENAGSWNLSQDVTIKNSTEWLDYTRGTALDTLARRNTLLPDIKLKAKWKATKTSSLEATLGWDVTKPGIFSTLGYVDTTNPLYIEMGNPNLHNSQSIGAKINYYITIPRGEQNFSVQASTNKNFSPFVRLYHYNTTTGAYIVTSENGRGGHDESLDINYDRSLGGHFRMNASTSFHNYIAYTLPTRIDDAPAADAMAQHKFSWVMTPDVRYDDEHWNVRLGSRIDYTRTTYSDAAYQNSATWRYYTSLDLRYKLEHWNFKLNPNLFGSCGYLSPMLNRPRCIVHAGIEWKFLKNRAKLSLEANDIFNQDKSYYSYVNTQERCEYGSSILHHYFTLGFTYRIDAKGKK